MPDDDIATSNRLSTPDDWSESWESYNPETVVFDPTKPIFADIHALLQRHLPKDDNSRFIEVGCYPGSYMWYFNRYYGYKPWGLDYVEWCCKACLEHLAKAGVDAEVINADFLSYEPPADELWDVVASVGFIEHFTNTEEVINKHLDMIKPGGYLVLAIPNHQKVYGELLKRIDIDKYRIHNCMTYD
ncbi:MAG: class I SAM-dependent methyltransferase, partial [Gammaproteobacteria bacterium]